ncbi:hypothetical protein V8E51_010800 [Hyaloscypha variabilis]
MTPLSPPACSSRSPRSPRLSSVSSLFSRSKTKTPAEKTKPQDLDQASQKAPMEQQGAKAEGSGGVRFSKVKVGRGCAVVMVSTIGKEVEGTDIEIDDHTTWHGGQMSPESLQGLPKAHGTEESTMRDQSTEDGGPSRYGAGHVLGRAASTGDGVKRPS